MVAYFKVYCGINQLAYKQHKFSTNSEAINIVVNSRNSEFSMIKSKFCHTMNSSRKSKSNHSRYKKVALCKDLLINSPAIIIYHRDGTGVPELIVTEKWEHCLPLNHKQEAQNMHATTPYEMRTLLVICDYVPAAEGALEWPRWTYFLWAAQNNHHKGRRILSNPEFTETRKLIAVRIKGTSFSHSFRMTGSIQEQLFVSAGFRTLRCRIRALWIKGFRLLDERIHFTLRTDPQVGFIVSSLK